MVGFSLNPYVKYSLLAALVLFVIADSLIDLESDVECRQNGSTVPVASLSGSGTHVSQFSVLPMAFQYELLDLSRYTAFGALNWQTHLKLTPGTCFLFYSLPPLVLQESLVLLHLASNLLGVDGQYTHGHLRTRAKWRLEE